MPLNCKTMTQHLFTHTQTFWDQKSCKGTAGTLLLYVCAQWTVRVNFLTNNATRLKYRVINQNVRVNDNKVVGCNNLELFRRLLTLTSNLLKKIYLTITINHFILYLRSFITGFGPCTRFNSSTNFHVNEKTEISEFDKT